MFRGFDDTQRCILIDDACLLAGVRTLQNLTASEIMFSQRSSLNCIQSTCTISSAYPGPVNVYIDSVDLDSRSLSCIPFYISVRMGLLMCRCLMSPSPHLVHVLGWHCACLCVHV